MRNFKEQLEKIIISNGMDESLKAPAYAISNYVQSKMSEFSKWHDEQRKIDRKKYK